MPPGKFSCQSAPLKSNPCSPPLSSPCNWSCTHARTRSTSKQASAREKEKNSQEPLLTIFNVSVFSLLFFQLLLREDSEIKFDNNKVEFSREGVASQDDVVKHSLELQQTSTHIQPQCFFSKWIASAGAKMDGLFAVSAP